MKRVITYGTFDLLHYSHINLLRRARALGDYLIEVPFIYLKAIFALCSTAGFLFFCTLIVLPVLVEFQIMRRATDDEKHLVYLHGTMFLLSGLVAFSQLTGAKPLWFSAPR